MKIPPDKCPINGEGLITGVIDREFHVVKLGVLAAAYLSWIRYDGIADPQFADKKGQFWMASPVNAKRLRQEYDAVCVNTFPNKTNLSFRLSKRIPNITML